MNDIQYELTDEDRVKFLLYFISTSEMHRRARRRYRVFPSAVFILMGGLYCVVESWLGAGLFGLSAILWFYVSPHWVRRRYRKHCWQYVRETTSEQLRGPVILAFKDDGIHSASRAGEATIRYAAVDRMATDEGVTYVFIGKDQALILPHDRIGKDRVDALVAEINTRRQTAVKPDAESED